MSIRLRHVIKDLNISLTTIKQFIQHNCGIDTTSMDINGRISDEQHKLLKEKFGKKDNASTEVESVPLQKQEEHIETINIVPTTESTISKQEDKTSKNEQITSDPTESNPSSEKISKLVIDKTYNVDKLSFQEIYNDLSAVKNGDAEFNLSATDLRKFFNKLTTRLTPKKERKKKIVFNLSRLISYLIGKTKIDAKKKNELITRLTRIQNKNETNNNTKVTLSSIKKRRTKCKTKDPLEKFKQKIKNCNTRQDIARCRHDILNLMDHRHAAILNYELYLREIELGFEEKPQHIERKPKSTYIRIISVPMGGMNKRY